MKVLVTGSNGLLGQKLLDYYKQFPEIELIATAKGADRYPNPGSYTYCSLDITNEAEVMDVLNATKPSVVIHTAAMTNVDACELDQTNCDLLNVKAVEFIANACNQINAHLVHLSTDFIFDGTHGPLAEEETPKPLSYYGLSKYKAEQIVQNTCRSWAILRTVLVYGVVKDMSRSNIVLWAKNALESGKSIQVVADQFRTPTLAEDLAQGCALAAQSKANGIFHISGLNFMSVFDLVIQVADFWKLDKALINLSSSEGIQQPAKRPPITGFQINKAKSVLGYQPHTFKEGLQMVANQLNSLNHE
jgi:dTDP-4-dehydrorhamnose reductase